jgi:hypothetical protein
MHIAEYALFSNEWVAAYRMRYGGNGDGRRAAPLVQTWLDQGSVARVGFA